MLFLENEPLFYRTLHGAPWVIALLMLANQAEEFRSNEITTDAIAAFRAMGISREKAWVTRSIAPGEVELSICTGIEAEFRTWDASDVYVVYRSHDAEVRHVGSF
ncbi:TPA: hypothetical protein ACKRQV_000231 [Pseudomonas aeruginosa]|nr:hypothetical protein [Pseudomonas aeruginosa]EIU2862512.1 hypothetical protein [Pseudomonas aeruginosa]